MPAARAKRKVRTAVYLPEDISRRLKREKGDTDIPVTTRVEEILRDYFARLDRKPTTAA